MGDINLKIAYENLFGYSVSKEFSDEILTKLRDDSKVNFDTCVEISDVGLFFEMLDQEMQKSAKFLGVDACDYAGKVIMHDAKIPANFPWLKNKSYFYQKEIRGLWQPLPGVDVNPKIINVPRAKEVCRIIHP